MVRYYLRFVLVATFLVAVAVVLFRTGNRVSLENVLDFSSVSRDILPELLQRIRNFHRVVTRDGVRVLELSAEEASFFKDDSTVVVKAPKITFFDDGREFATISADEARLNTNGNEVDSADLAGHVIIKVDRFRVDSATITYDNVERRIVAPGFVTIASPDLNLKGTGLTLNLDDRTLALHKSVTMNVVHRGTGGAGS